MTKPAQVHQLHGTHRGDRHGAGPRVEVKAPECPAWLPAKAKKYWAEIVPLLEQSGLVAEQDSAVLQLHCDSMGKFLQVSAKLKTLDSLLDKTPQGYAVQSALFTVRNKLWDQVMSSAREFGLSPLGRNKVTAQQTLPFGDDGWGNV